MLLSAWLRQPDVFCHSSRWRHVNSPTAQQQCPSFPEHGACLLGHQNRQGWNCDICLAIERWKLEGRDRVLLREILSHRGLYVRPAEAGGIPAWDHGCYLLQMRFRDTPSNESGARFNACWRARSKHGWQRKTAAHGSVEPIAWLGGGHSTVPDSPNLLNPLRDCAHRRHPVAKRSSLFSTG